MFTRSRRRLAYLFAVPMGFILFGFTFIVYYRQAQNQLQSFDKRLHSQAEKIIERLGKNPNIFNNIDIYKNRNFWRQVIGDSNICLYDSDRNLKLKISVEPPYNLCSSELNTIKGFKTIRLKLNADENNLKSLSIPLRQLTIPLKKRNTHVGYLQLTSSLERIEINLSQTRLFLSLGIPITLGIIIIVGWLLGGLAIQPAETAYKQLNRFTADASHELRAPIAAILSNAQVGLLAPQSNTEQPRQRLENIVEISKTMSALISNLLFLARHEGLLDADKLDNIDLVKFLSELVQEHKPITRDKEITLTTKFPSHEVNIKAESELLKQAIRNLLDNAFKYTLDKGKIDILLTTRWTTTKSIGKFSLPWFPMQASRQALIEIQDSGVGIPEQDLPHIFDRFYRVDTARTRATGGFGLGLAISLQIIQAHGGKITVNSKLDKGTTFQIFLPLRRPLKSTVK